MTAAPCSEWGSSQGRLIQPAGLAERRGTKTIGLAVGDYDLDGWPDLFCSGYQTTNRLYHNQGEGRFREGAKALRRNGQMA